MLHLQDQHVLILGLGASGLAMARWCAAAGAQLTVADTRPAPPGLTTLKQEWPGIRFVSGPLNAELVRGTPVRVVLRSPGLSPVDAAPVLEAAKASGLWLGGELDLFSQALGSLRTERGYAPQVLAVTGTNGKTTVTALTGQLVARAGKTVAVAGNIGPTLLDTLTQRLAALLAAVGSDDPKRLADLAEPEVAELTVILTYLGRQVLPVRVVLNRWAQQLAPTATGCAAWVGSKGVHEGV